jgi:hypothetical protein
VFEYVYSVADFRDRHQLLEARDPNRAITRYEYYQRTDPPGRTQASSSSWTEEFSSG